MASRSALVVRGGWDGHVPVAATDLFIPSLVAHGFDVTVREDLDGYADVDGLLRHDLIVQCWSMGTLTGGEFLFHHPSFVDYRVHVVPSRADQPIVAGIGPFDVHTEQYWVIADAYNDVLATTAFEPYPGGDFERPVTMPVVWTRQWGRGRVFVSTIGHRVADLEVPEVRAVTGRGLRWASRAR
jgi:type 1 glutamine amidotransferase